MQTYRGKSTHVHSHLSPLTNNEAGDKIALFGFSRGAFTARVLAGMLHCVSLVQLVESHI